MESRRDFIYSKHWLNMFILILSTFVIYPAGAGWLYIFHEIESPANIVIVSIYTIVALFVFLYTLDKLLKFNSYEGHGILHDDFAEISYGSKFHSLKYKDIDSIEKVQGTRYTVGDRWIIFIKGRLKIPLGNIIIYEPMVTLKRDRIKYIDPLIEFMNALKERLDGV